VGRGGCGQGGWCGCGQGTRVGVTHYASHTSYTMHTIHYAPCTIHYAHHTLCTMHHTLCTPYTMHHTLCTPYMIHHAHHTSYTMHTIHYAPCTMHHAPCTIHHSPYTIHLVHPCTISVINQCAYSIAVINQCTWSPPCTIAAGFANAPNTDAAAGPHSRRERPRHEFMRICVDAYMSRCAMCVLSVECMNKCMMSA
jgi:hypothetical protein